MKWIKENDEVLYPEQSHKLVAIAKKDIDYLEDVARSNVRNRSRICAHRTVKDDIHEMIIYHPQGAYVCPHKHMGKDESFHLISGEIDLVLFDDHGNIENILEMGNYKSGKTFYYRIPLALFHTQIFRQNTLFHEVTKGPFNKKDTIIAKWAPDEKNERSAKEYLQKLNKHITVRYYNERTKNKQGRYS